MITRRKAVQLLMLGGGALIGRQALQQPTIRALLFPAERELAAFFRFAQEELDGMLDDTTYDTVSDLNHIFYTNLENEDILDEDWSVGETFSFKKKEEREAEIARHNSLQRNNVMGFMYREKGVHIPEEHRVVINEQYTLRLSTLGHELTHAVLNPGETPRQQRRSELFAFSLGELALPLAYHQRRLNQDLVKQHLESARIVGQTQNRETYSFRDDEIKVAARLAASKESLRNRFAAASNYLIS